MRNQSEQQRQTVTASKQSEQQHTVTARAEGEVAVAEWKAETVTAREST